MLKSPSQIVSIVPSREKTARTELKVLDAYLSHLSLWSSQSGHSDSIQFEKAEVAVSPWMAKMVHRFCNSAVPPGEIEDLVARGVALIAKCRTDLASETTGHENLADVYSRQAEMMLDVAVGTIVVHGLQEKCNELLATGDNDDVRELNQLQHETRNMVLNVRNSLSGSEKSRASELATTFQPGAETKVEARAPRAPARVETKVEARAPRAPAKVETSAGRRPLVIPVTEASSRPRRFRSRALSLTLVAILAGVTIYWVARQRFEPVRGNTAESLLTLMSNEPAVTQVQDRMPYIVLTVQAVFWGSSSHSQRTQWIEDLSRLAERHGYTGLVVRSDSGIPLVEWVRGRGIHFAEGA